jgi:two-component system, NtrC family, sensor histidine kinase HydH
MGRPLSMKWNLGKILFIALLVAFTLSLHYMWLPVPHSIHLLHRRLCYIPIILGALWFGLRGGVGTALVISLAVTPLAWERGGPLLMNEEWIEILFYFTLGSLSGWLVDRREAEREKKANLEKDLAMAERFASAGRTAAGIAHEVRTPLASVQGSVEILAEDYPEAHPRRPYFDILAKETERLRGVMDEFLDLNRKVSITPLVTELGPFLEDCIAALRPAGAARGVRLRLATQDSMTVRLDPERMRQVVTNLLRNAIQASPEGGTVSLFWDRRDGGIEISVEDMGPGIPQADLDRIFEPFYTRKTEGVGLGLSLARQIVAAHGGTLRAENRPGGGARFTIALPTR